MKFIKSTEEALSLLIKHRAIVLLIIFILFLTSVLVSTFSYFSQKKRASISAQIAIGLAYLEEDKKDTALFYLQNAFNQSKGLYGVISGVGMVKALKGDPDFNSKATHIVSIIKDYKSHDFIQMVILSSYLQHISHFNKSAFSQKDFEKLQKFATQKGEPFLEQVKNIKLNLAY